MTTVTATIDPEARTIEYTYITGEVRILDGLSDQERSDLEIDFDITFGPAESRYTATGEELTDRTVDLNGARIIFTGDGLMILRDLRCRILSEGFIVHKR